ncbi:MAG: hypothetical protein A3J24_02345 [Deltaproteobacteria bacterium RIFCSPLOWO2_02_FULL_53_8]|nr:MAG: hypothetical protein A3J24_02345 [Deltaproteobacteria bacterium RIFCSPLOWO2_02_FULL_53_8]
MVAMVITMFIVAAAAYVYLGTRESQGALERSAVSAETGSFALEFIGRDIMNAGFYPSTMPPIATYTPTMGRASSYPPTQGIPVLATDWIAPHVIYLTPIFGCEGGKFDPKTATCAATVADDPDSIVLNYFTSESANFGANIGQRHDCTGAKVENDPSNAIRKLNQGSPIAISQNNNLPPQQPLFASNFYGLNATNMVVDGQAISTQSLACGGNGNTPFGSTITATYVPLVAGVEDMQFTYGVYNTEATRTPDRFYTATEVNALATKTIDGIALGPWSRVVAVRVCLLSRTLGGNTKIADKAGALRTYVNCSGQTVTQAASDTTLYKRHDQVFALRNRLNELY